MYCTKSSLTSSYISLYESEDLPSRIRVFVSASNNKLLAEAWKCPIGSQIAPNDICSVFPYIDFKETILAPEWRPFTEKCEWMAARERCDLAAEAVKKTRREQKCVTHVSDLLRYFETNLKNERIWIVEFFFYLKNKLGISSVTARDKI